MEQEKKVPLSIKIDPHILERLDNIAEQSGLTRSRLVTNLIEVGIDALEQCQKIGILQFTILLRDLRKNTELWAAGWKKKKVNITE